MFFHPLIAPADECANCSRRGVKNIDPVLLDDLPKPIRLRPIWRALVHECSRAVSERPINHITVPGHPADIGRAPKNVLLADVEDIFRGRINSNQITAGGVKNLFRPAGRTAGVKYVEGMLAVERGWGAII